MHRRQEGADPNLPSIEELEAELEEAIRNARRAGEIIERIFSLLEYEEYHQPGRGTPDIRQPVNLKHELGKIENLSPESLQAILELVTDPAAQHSPGRLARITGVLQAIVLHLWLEAGENARAAGVEFDHGVFFRDTIELPFIPVIPREEQRA